MLRFAFALIFVTNVLGAAASAQEDLRKAISAAMGEAVSDHRYKALLDAYGLPMPDTENEPFMAAPGRVGYPDRVNGTMLDRVLTDGNLRLGWVRIAIPFSAENQDGEPEGLTIDLWPIILEKLNEHYDATVSPTFVKYTAQTGNNDMYKYLATSTNPDCANAPPPGPELCYDMIGGGYALNEPRKKVSAFTPAYYPLNMAAVRTPTPLIDTKGNEVALTTAEDALKAAADPDVRPVFVVLDATGEQQFLNGLKDRVGETFDVIIRPARSNVMEYAQDSKAHMVLGTNVRLHHTRKMTPEFCSDCPIIENLLKFDGVGFATSKPLQD